MPGPNDHPDEVGDDQLDAALEDVEPEPEEEPRNDVVEDEADLAEGPGGAPAGGGG